MSDAWRRKSYYRPRVLVQTAAVLESTFPDAVVCLTGGQVNLLRALLEYADRRSTFVSEYQTDGYLAPTEEEWEQLTDVVAQLEEAMSGCETIAERLACICSAIQGLQASQTVDPDLLPEGQPYFDNEDSDVEEDAGDPPVSEDWDAWRVYRCKGAQMIVDDVIDVTTNWAQVAEDVGIITFTLLEGTLFASLVGIPAAVLGAIASFLLSNLTEFVWSETVEWISENKLGLVCAITTAETSAAAKAAVNAYIASEWDKLWSAGFVKLVFTRHTLKQLFDEALPSYTSRSGNYTATYCLVCEDQPEQWVWDEAVDGCPGDWTLGTGADCNGTLVRLDSAEYAYTPALGPFPYSQVDVDFTAEWYTGGGGCQLYGYIQTYDGEEWTEGPTPCSTELCPVHCTLDSSVKTVNATPTRLFRLRVKANNDKTLSLATFTFRVAEHVE